MKLYEVVIIFKYSRLKILNYYFAKNVCRLKNLRSVYNCYLFILFHSVTPGSVEMFSVIHRTILFHSVTPGSVEMFSVKTSQHFQELPSEIK